MSGSVPYWRSPDSVWDVLYLNNQRLPGICELDITKSRSIQINKSKKENGTTLADNGYEGAKITGTLRIWTDEQLDELIRILPQFDPRNSAGVSNPIAINHPQATLAGVSKIYAPSWKFPKPNDELIVSFEAVEWFPAPKKTGGGGGAGKSGSIIQDGLDAIGDLTDFLASPTGQGTRFI